MRALFLSPLMLCLLSTSCVGALSVDDDDDTVVVDDDDNTTGDDDTMGDDDTCTDNNASIEVFVYPDNQFDPEDTAGTVWVFVGVNCPIDTSGHYLDSVEYLSSQYSEDAILDNMMDWTTFDFFNLPVDELLVWAWFSNSPPDEPIPQDGDWLSGVTPQDLSGPSDIGCTSVTTENSSHVSVFVAIYAQI